MEQYMKNWKREMFSLKGGENEEPEIGWADQRELQKIIEKIAKRLSKEQYEYL